ncbi:hypothetical protein BJ742DRAFT_832605 [Cladochytrium replicatum]|nr:hypothetical protein BJ742DRAFT_832605 [Cladochytrium replicatum]
MVQPLLFIVLLSSLRAHAQSSSSSTFVSSALSSSDTSQDLLTRTITLTYEPQSKPGPGILKNRKRRPKAFPHCSPAQKNQAVLHTSDPTPLQLPLLCIHRPCSQIAAC